MGGRQRVIWAHNDCRPTNREREQEDGTDRGVPYTDRTQGIDGEASTLVRTTVFDDGLKRIYYQPAALL